MVDCLTGSVAMMHINLPHVHGSSVILTGSKSPAGTGMCLILPQAHCAST